MDTKKKSINLNNTPFIEAAGTEMVDLYIGPTKTLIRVHKEILCKKIDYFDKMFNGTWVESTNKSATFPEDTVESFELLVGWVYSGSLRPLVQSDKKFSIQWNALDLYSLCDKLCIPAVMDEVMDLERDSNRTSGAFVSVEYWNIVYKQLPERSKFRLYALNFLLYLFTTYPDLDISIIEDSLDNKDLRKDFLYALWEQVCKKKTVVDPRTEDDCIYHTHKPGEECIRKQNKLKVK
ncbi:hypothetical protein NHQ30_002076 [Ciborinia camelliae]|nr:hypothetical protein NHQ30_002076 [Ciborinia camelliae]